MSKENGGQAFPYYENAHGVTNGAEGMTLRDYFAAKADIPWTVAADIVYRQNGNANGTIGQIIQKRTQLQFQHADEMLLERAK